MKTTFTFLIFLSLLSSTIAQVCTIDQADRNAFININNDIAAGQRFKACNSGVITQIRVFIDALNATELRLQLSSGNNTLNPEYTQDFSASAAGDVFIDLTTPFPVEAEQNYAYTILPLNATGTSNIWGTSENQYPDGNAISESNGQVSSFAGDEDFTITIEDALCVLNQPQRNAFININNDIAAGQRFKACNSGVITQIRVFIDALNATQLRLQLSAGNNTLNPEYTQDFTANAAGDVFIDLTTPFLVEADQNYTYTILPLNATGTSNIWGTTENRYPDGNAISESNGQVSSFAGDEDFTITIESSPFPVNDLSCNAIALPANGSVQAGFNNTNGTASDGEEAIAPGATSCVNSWCAEEVNGGNTIQVQTSVWFSFDAPESNAVAISTCGMADFDTQLALYEANDCGDFSTYTLIGANDDGPISCATDFDSYLEAHGLIEGQTYFVMVDGFDGANGNFDISITPITSTSTEAVEALNNEMQLYPNPSDGHFTLEWKTEDFEAAQIVVLSITGQVIYQQKANPSGQQQIDFSDRSKGLYLVQIRTDNRVVSKRLMIQ
ncbi:MAG: T9SS type A sorting domain-containing protein [Bacteroidota bacterium]